VHILFIVEYDNYCRIMIVGVDNVLYHILGRGDGHQSRCRPRVSGGVAKFSSRWRLLRMTQIVNKCEDNC
jgi:hypothetical protein